MKGCELRNISGLADRCAETVDAITGFGTGRTRSAQPGVCRGRALGVAVVERVGFGRPLRAQQSGQVLVLAAVGMVAICGMAGFVIDVGVWYQAHRKQQSIADAAALAAANDLPTSTAQATADAASFASKNGGTTP